MRALFVTQYGPLAASSRTRVFGYLPLLGAAGMRCDVLVAIPDALRVLQTGGPVRRGLYYALSWLRVCWVGWRCVAMVWQYDAIFVQKVLFAFPIPRILRWFRHKVVFDFDDAIFTLENPRTNWLARARSHRRTRGLPAMLQASGHAIVENAYTADYARRFCPAVSRITGPIDTDRYAPGPVKMRDEVVLGWIGSQSTTPYLELIREPLEELGRRHRHLKLSLIGAGPFELTNLSITHQTWALETEVAHLRAFDIGLMPLPDDAWTRGKGGYKLLQYMAMGLPVIASPVEINREIVAHDINGFLAETPEEWVAYLERLIGNAHLRQQMGAAGRRHVVARYSLKKSSRYLLEILQATKRRSFKTG